MKKVILRCFILLHFRPMLKMDDTQKLGDTIKKDVLTAPDTVKRLHSKPWALIPPAGLIAYGVSSFVCWPYHAGLITYMRVETRKNRVQLFIPTAESYFQFAP